MSVHSRRKKILKSEHGAAKVDYKDVHFLKGHISETGKIIPSRITGASARTQREVSKAIKLARFLALLPYCDSHR